MLGPPPQPAAHLRQILVAMPLPIQLLAGAAHCLAAKHRLQPRHHPRRVFGQLAIAACYLLHLQRARLPVIHRRQHPRPQQLRQLARVDRIALAARLQQRILPRIAHHQLFYPPHQYVVEPCRMRPFLKGHVQRPPHPMNEIQNRTRPRRQHRLHRQPPTLVQYRHRNRVPVDIHPDISHTVHQGSPLVALLVVCFSQHNRSLHRKGRPFIMRAPFLAPFARSGHVTPHPRGKPTAPLDPASAGVSFRERLQRYFRPTLSTAAPRSQNQPLQVSHVPSTAHVGTAALGCPARAKPSAPAIPKAESPKPGQSHRGPHPTQLAPNFPSIYTSTLTHAHALAPPHSPRCRIILPGSPDSRIPARRSPHQSSRCPSNSRPTLRRRSVAHPRNRAPHRPRMAEHPRARLCLLDPRRSLHYANAIQSKLPSPEPALPSAP